MVYQQKILIHTAGRGTQDITPKLREILHQAAISCGICHVFLHHTSASLVLCENADPAVRRDLENWLQKQVLDGDPDFTHTDEGKDDMSAHIRSILTGCSLTLPVSAGCLELGTWQGVYLYEHRLAPQQRYLTVTLYGDN